jgi:hypothetical protein
MKTYSVKKRFGRKYKINGMDYYYEIQRNQVIQGTPTLDGRFVRLPIRIANRHTSFAIPTTNLIEQITESSEKRSSVDGTDTGVSENTKTSIFTTRNIVMGVVAIALVFGLLKVTKVIK